MSDNRVADYLGHMLEAAKLALSYVDGLPKEGFVADKRTQQAVILNLVVIGEAAAKVCVGHPAFAEQHSVVPFEHEGHAQPHCTWLLRHRSGHCLGHGPDGAA